MLELRLLFVELFDRLFLLVARGCRLLRRHSGIIIVVRIKDTVVVIVSSCIGSGRGEDLLLAGSRSFLGRSRLLTTLLCGLFGCGGGSHVLLVVIVVVVGHAEGIVLAFVSHAEITLLDTSHGDLVVNMKIEFCVSFACCQKRNNELCFSLLVVDGFSLVTKKTSNDPSTKM